MSAEKLVAPTLGAWAAPRRVFGNAQRLLRTHAFRLAALYFLVFAVSVLGVLLFVYWTSADFVERQTEATLDAEITGLAEQYAQRGLSGLVQIVAARSAGDRGDGMLYLVTDPSGARQGADRGPPGARRIVHHSGELPLVGRSRHQRRNRLP